MPRLSVIIPAYNRPASLDRAIASALAQTMDDLEVIVVDDASPEPLGVPEHPRVRLIRLDENQGVAGAQNVGVKAARSQWVTFLDDDDELFPHFAAESLDALAQSTLPGPVAVISGLLVVRGDGAYLHTRIPPTIPRGGHFQLENAPASLSFFTKQTLVVEREVLLGVGGYDPYVSGREDTDLFLRLNPVCSILGIPVVAYQHRAHEGPKPYSVPDRRQAIFDRILKKHDALLRAHPAGFARFLFRHAVTMWNLGRRREAARTAARAARMAPLHASSLLATELARIAVRRVRVSKS